MGYYSRWLQRCHGYNFPHTGRMIRISDKCFDNNKKWQSQSHLFRERLFLLFWYLTAASSDSVISSVGESPLLPLPALLELFDDGSAAIVDEKVLDTGSMAEFVSHLLRFSWTFFKVSMTMVWRSKWFLFAEIVRWLLLLLPEPIGGLVEGHLAPN